MTDENKRMNTTGSLKAGIMISSFIAVLIFLDRITKFLAETFLMGTDGVFIIDKVLKLQYLENRGAAFGMLQGRQVLFWILTAVVAVFLIWFFTKVPKNKYYRPVIIAIAVLFSGAIGNFIDRIVNHYVIDFIYFELIDFPIFNVADIYVTISVILLLILILFRYKEGDFFFITGKKKKNDE
ncbi:MAG: signal peptidase II [Candidatus Alectryocaccobium sp.]